MNLGIDYSKWTHYETLAIHSGHRIMHPEFCMISDRPKTLLVDAQNRPHCETGPFCEWRDGSKLYALNGVRVPAYIVETPASELNPKFLLEESNAEVKREIIKKVGVQRIYKALGAKTIDADMGYELITLNLGDERHRPFLKMVNPSIGEVHIEGVHPDCSTVKAAIAWRNGLKEYSAPIKLT